MSAKLKLIWCIVVFCTEGLTLPQHLGGQNISIDGGEPKALGGDDSHIGAGTSWQGRSNVLHFGESSHIFGMHQRYIETLERLNRCILLNEDLRAEIKIKNQRIGKLEEENSLLKESQHSMNLIDLHGEESAVVKAWSGSEGLNAANKTEVLVPKKLVPQMNTTSQSNLSMLTLTNDSLNMSKCSITSEQEARLLASPASATGTSNPITPKIDQFSGGIAFEMQVK